MKFRNNALLIFSVFLLSGCSSYARLTYEFQQINTTQKIFYETEAKDIAVLVSKSLPISIDLITKEQYVDFKDIEFVKIYIFSSKEHYANFSRSTPKARGSATKNEIYISSIIRKRIETLSPILIHELSHVHLRQYIGTWRYWTEVPGWFHEGLAVKISDGGGAEKITDKQAFSAIKAGKHFIPPEESSLFGHEFASDYNLKPHMYYRQSYLFVNYLINTNPDAFKKVYLSLIEGIKFKDVWISHYGKPISQLWESFLNSV